MLANCPEQMLIQGSETGRLQINKTKYECWLFVVSVLYFYNVNWWKNYNNF